jgi:hypothetical protein
MNEQETKMNSRERIVHHFTMWLRELDECRAGGLLSDEDYAFQRAEKLEELFGKARKRWLGWVLVVLPIALAGAAYGWWVLGDLQIALGCVAIAVLCMAATYSRYRRDHMSDNLDEMQLVLRALLDHDLITSPEFLAYDERLSTGKQPRF